MSLWLRGLSSPSPNWRGIIVNAIAQRLRVSSEDLAALTSQAAHPWIVISGKMASGKDSLAERLNHAGYDGTARLLRYGDLMRNELEPALELWRSNPQWDEGEVVGAFCDTLGISALQSAQAVESLWEDMSNSSHTLTAWGRSNGLRYTLQALGGQWRLPQDQDYWARAAALEALTELSSRPVILTGGRFKSDVEIPRALGAIILRLDISAEEQRRRLTERDRHDIDPKTLSHPGETALDKWPHFDAHIDNNGSIDAALENALQAIERTLNYRKSSSNPQ